jgi:hypothetical protein
MFTSKFYKMLYSLCWCYMLMICFLQEKSWLRSMSERFSWIDVFDMKDLGAAKQILGIELHRDMKHGKIWFSQ